MLRNPARIAALLAMASFVLTFAYYAPRFMPRYQSDALNWAIYQSRPLGLSWGRVAFYAGMLFALASLSPILARWAPSGWNLVDRVFSRAIVWVAGIVQGPFQESGVPANPARRKSQLARRRAKIAIYILTFCVVLPGLGSLLLFEITTRLELVANFVGWHRVSVIKNETEAASPIDKLMGIDVSDHPEGIFKPNRDLKIWFVDWNNDVVLRTHGRTNNYGMLSDRDYPDPKAPKPVDEFRILFLGDSMTGGTTMNIHWVDVVAENLNAEPNFARATGGKRAATFNAAVPGSGFSDFLRFYLRAGKKWNPDLVIVNYIESDFPRINQAQVRPAERLNGGFIPYQHAGVPNEILYLQVQCVGDRAISLKDPDCYQFFSFFGSEQLVENKAALNDIFGRITSEYLWTKAVFTLYPYSYYKWKGRSQTFTNFRNPEMFHRQTPEEDDMVLDAVKYLREIAGDAKDTLVTLMPLHQDMFPKFEDYRLSKRVMAAMPELPITVMRERMPLAGLTGKDVARWYNLPYDGHMSEMGGRIYAKLMAERIIEHLEAKKKAKAVQ
jgi:hypothetical protein